jgi:hypothetical protein
MKCKHIETATINFTVTWCFNCGSIKMIKKATDETGGEIEIGKWFKPNIYKFQEHDKIKVKKVE